MNLETHLLYRNMKNLFKRISITAVLLVIFAISSGFSSLYNAFDDDLPDWALLDPEKDGYEGTRTITFYKYMASLPNPPQRGEVIVAVIDSGFDINHPDLKNNIWQNEAEVNGTPGVDDDNNGYIDDFNGWNFLGDLKYSNYEMTREYVRLKKNNVPESDPYFRKVIREIESEREEVEGTLKGLMQSQEVVDEAYKTLKSGGYPTDPEKLKVISDNLTGEYKEAASSILTVYLLFGIT